MSFRVVGSLAGWCGVVLCLAATSLVAASPAGAVAGFGDVAEGRYYAEPVQWSVDNDVAGIDGNCFLPDAPVSRGEAAVYIWNMEGQPSGAPAHSFVDVTDESQDAAVSWMSHNEITTGTSTTTFDPDTALTRAHLVTFLWRLANEPAAPDHPFVDVHASWQQGSVSWAADRGITTGTSPTTFDPDGTLTRAHLVTFLYRYQGEPDVMVDPASPECDPDAAPVDESAVVPVDESVVVVPVDGSAVTVPAGAGFVADLGLVTVEGGPGVFSEATEVRIAYSEVGVGEHSRLTATAAQPVLLDFGGVQPEAPLTLRFSTGRAGLKAEHVTPAVWDAGIGAWVPTIGDEVTVHDGEIIVTTAVAGSTAGAAVNGFGLGGVTVAAEGFGSAPVQVLGWPNCDTWGVSLVCGGVEKVVTVYVPALVHTAEDAASDFLEGVVDIAGLSADAVVAKAREYLPKVMEAIEAGIARGLDAGIAFVEEWLLPALADFFGLREDAPQCSGAAPDWASDGIDFSETGKPDPRLHLCTENGSGEDLRVTTVNNRNFGFQVTSNDVPLKNFTAQELRNVSVGTLLTNKANGFLVDKLEALGGYQWPLSEASFDIAEFDRSDRSESTTEWKVTKHTAMLDAILMASDLRGRAADHIPYAAVALDAVECTTLTTLIPDVDFVIVEQSTHWITILSAVGSCLSTVATALAATVLGLPASVVLEFVAQILETVATQGTIIKQRITQAEFALELIKQPPILTIQPAETPDTPDTPTPTTPTPTAASNTVTAGGAHTCGLRTDATITCWGRNREGQVDAPDGTFTAVTAGWWHTCGLRTDATITCWGRNRAGQTAAPDGTFTAVTTGYRHTCGLRTDATITCWGHNGYGQVDAPDGTFAAVTAGWYHTCGLRTDATITCWGHNRSGQVDAPDGTFTAVTASRWYTCGLRTDATITCWGRNSEGQVDAPDGTFTAVTAGGFHTCGLRTDATITCWGRNSEGQVDAPDGTFTAVTAGGAHTCGLRTDATITCWGENGAGQADAPDGTFGPVGGSGPTVTVTKGSPGPTEIGPGQGVACAADTPTCRYINIELRGFASGTYTVSCSHDGWADFGPSTFWTFSITVADNGSASRNGPCFINFAQLTGNGAYVTVSRTGTETVRSNSLQ